MGADLVVVLEEFTGGGPDGPGFWHPLARIWTPRYQADPKKRSARKEPVKTDIIDKFILPFVGEVLVIKQSDEANPGIVGFEVEVHADRGWRKATALERMDALCTAALRRVSWLTTPRRASIEAPDWARSALGLNAPLVVYVAGSSQDVPHVRAIQQKILEEEPGMIRINFDWTERLGAPEGVDQANFDLESARLDFEAVRDCQCLVAVFDEEAPGHAPLLQKHKVSEGRGFEMGVAAALGTPVILVGRPPPRSIFHRLENCFPYDPAKTWIENIVEAIQARQGKRL